ncbi:MAG: hypothetical protein H6623_07385 [Bdellovibrionaceae bacterium]|nr:hypothetical protein [Pseudobdellovibrionaceae bacterium]
MKFLCALVFFTSITAFADAIPAGMTPVYCGDQNNITYPEPAANGIQSVCLSELRNNEVSPFNSYNRYVFVNRVENGKMIRFVFDLDHPANMRPNQGVAPDNCLGAVNEDKLFKYNSVCGFEVAPTGVIKDGIYTPRDVEKLPDGSGWYVEIKLHISTGLFRNGDVWQRVEIQSWWEVEDGSKGIFRSDVSPQATWPF